MVSHIDPTQPIFGEPTTLSVRNNFAFAKIEIESLQDTIGTGNFLPITGGTITGNLTVNNNLTVLGLVSGAGFTNLLAPYALTSSLSAYLRLIGGAITGDLSVAGNFSVAGTISGNGFTNYLASPPAIGNVAPNTGNFTNLNASGTVTGAGFTTALGAYLPLVGGTLTGGLIFTNNTGTGNTDTSKQITLYTGYGLGITSNRLNYVVPSAIGIHAFMVNAVAVGQITSTGINSTAIGATTASTGAFTNLSANGTVSGAGFAPYALIANVPVASSTLPIVNGTAAIGALTTYAKADHIHPIDTSRYDASNPAGYQTAAQVTAVLPIASSTSPLMDGIVAIGAGTTWARSDHRHPSDTSKADVLSLGNYLPLTGGVLSGTLSFGATLAGSNTDLTKHISLHTAGYGFNVTSGRINYSVAAGGIHVFNIAGVDYVTINASGINSAAIGAVTPSTGAFTNLSSSGTISGAGFTTLLAPYALTANVPVASSTLPTMNSVATIGVGTTWARSDHIHPSDTTKYDASNPSGYQTAAQVTTSLAGYLPLTGGTLTAVTSATTLAVTNTLSTTAPIAFFNNNTSAATLGLTSGSFGIQVVASDTASVNGGFFIDGFATAGGLTGRRSRGTAAARTAILNNDQIVHLTALGHDGTSIAPYGGFTCLADTDSNSTNRGSFWRLNAINVGTTAILTPMEIHGSGLIMFGSNVNISATFEWARFQTNGNFSIGTLLDHGAKFNVRQTNNANPIALFSGANNNAPFQPFATNGGMVQLVSVDVGSGLFAGYAVDAYNNHVPLFMGRKTRGTNLAMTAVQLDDPIVRLVGQGNDGSGTFSEWGNFTLRATALSSVSEHSTYWETIATTALTARSVHRQYGTGVSIWGSNLPTTEWMRISPTGNLLIGTATDGTNKLDVVGATRFNGNMGFYNTTPIAKPTASGAKGSNAALASVIAALVALGLITDTTTA